MPASKAQQAATAERRAKAIALRIAGMDWQTIADRLGYSDRASACKDVTRALERHRSEESRQIEILRQLTEERLDRLQAAYWAKALQGDPKAAEIVMKVMDRRAKHDGTDAAQRLEVITIDAIDAEIRRISEQITALGNEASETAGTEAPSV